MDRRFVSLVLTSLAGIALYGGAAYVKAPLRAAEGVDNARRLWWKEQFDVVFVGDSRTHNGVAPSAMAESLPGFRLGNFGWSSLGWNAKPLEAARQTLDPSGRRVIVLGVTPHGFTQRSATQNAFLDTSQSAYLDKWAVKTMPLATNFFSSFGPNQWLRALNPELGQVPFEIHEDGWFEAHTQPLKGERIVRMYADRLRASPFDETLLDLLCSEVRRLRESGITVITYRPPVSPEMFQVESEVGRYDEAPIRRALTEVGAIYIDVPGTYTTYDGSHLNSEEAQRFSRELGKVLATAIPPKTP
jgi:hypothetical protein